MFWRERWLRVLRRRGTRGADIASSVWTRKLAGA